MNLHFPDSSDSVLSFHAEKRQLKSEIATHKDHINLLMAKVRALEGEIRKLEGVIVQKSLQSSNSARIEDNELLQAALEKNKRLSQKYQQLKDAITSSEFNSIIEEKNATIEKLLKKMQSRRSSSVNEELKASILQKEQHISELETHVQRLSSENSELEKQVIRLKRIRKDALNELNPIDKTQIDDDPPESQKSETGHKHHTESQINESQIKRNDIRKLIEQKDAEIIQLKKELREVKKIDYAALLKEVSNINHELEIILQNLQKEMSKVKQHPDFSVSISQLETMQAQSRDLLSKVQQLKQFGYMSVHSSNESKTLDHETEDQNENKIKLLLAENQRLKEKLNALEVRTPERKSEQSFLINELRLQVEELKNVKKSNESTLSVNHEEIKRLKAELSDIQKKLASSDDEVLVNQNSLLDEKVQFIEEQKNRIQSLEKKNKELKKELLALREAQMKLALPEPLEADSAIKRNESQALLSQLLQASEELKQRMDSLIRNLASEIVEGIAKLQAEKGDGAAGDKHRAGNQSAHLNDQLQLATQKIRTLEVSNSQQYIIIHSFASEMQKVHNSWNQVIEANKKFHAEISILRDVVNSKDQELILDKQIIQKLKAENNQLNQKNKELIKKTDNLKSKLNRLLEPADH